MFAWLASFVYQQEEPVSPGCSDRDTLHTNKHNPLLTQETPTPRRSVLYDNHISPELLRFQKRKLAPIPAATKRSSYPPRHPVLRELLGSDVNYH
jgi:hypothetical protein